MQFSCASFRVFGNLPSSVVAENGATSFPRSPILGKEVESGVFLSRETPKKRTQKHVVKRNG